MPTTVRREMPSTVPFPRACLSKFCLSASLGRRRCGSLLVHRNWQVGRATLGQLRTVHAVQHNVPLRRCEGSEYPVWAPRRGTDSQTIRLFQREDSSWELGQQMDLGKGVQE